MPTIYVDLDGTLLGKNASLLHDHLGNRTNIGIDALAKAEQAGADLVIATGRDRYRAEEFCRAAGIKNYIAELGCVLHTTGEDIVEYGEKATAFLQENALNEAEFLGCVTQAGEALIKHFPNQIEMHTPYNRDRFTSLLMRGNIPTDQANEILSSKGWPFLEIIPNGHGMFRRTMPNIENVLIYHLTPIGVNKAFGISKDQEIRNIEPQNSFMIGDGMADALCYGVVNKVYIPSNGALSDTDVLELSKKVDNIIVLEDSHNEGFAKAIDLILDEY